MANLIFIVKLQYFENEKLWNISNDIAIIIEMFIQRVNRSPSGNIKYYQYILYISKEIESSYKFINATDG